MFSYQETDSVLIQPLCTVNPWDEGNDNAYDEKDASWRAIANKLKGQTMSIDSEIS